MISYPSIPLGELTEILSGFAFKSSCFGSEGDLPIVRIRDVARGYSDTFYTGDYNNRYLVNDGDMLISMDGEFRLAKWQGGTALLNQRVCKITTSNSSLDDAYLAHFLPNELKQIEDKTPFVTVKHLSAKKIKGVPMPLPPIEEQRRIAAILDKADTIRRKREQALTLADDFLRSAFLEMFGDPVTNPKGWPIGTIRDLVAEAKYGTSKKAGVASGQFPILRMGNLTYEGGWNLADLKHIDLDETEKKKYLVQRDDILFNRTNSRELVGKTAVFDLDRPFAFAGYLVRARTNENADPYYVSAYMNSSHGKATLRAMCKSIVGMANINAQEFQNIAIALPPIGLQKEFRQVVEATKKTKAINITALTETRALFAALSQRAFKGEL